MDCRAALKMTNNENSRDEPLDEFRDTDFPRYPATLWATTVAGRSVAGLSGRHNARARRLARYVCLLFARFVICEPPPKMLR